MEVRKKQTRISGREKGRGKGLIQEKQIKFSAGFPFYASPSILFLFSFDGINIPEKSCHNSQPRSFKHTFIHVQTFSID